jgi:hypothetical protein
MVSDMPPDVSNSSRMLARNGLAEFVDKRKKLWQMTGSGTEVMATTQWPPQTLPIVTTTVTPQQ